MTIAHTILPAAPIRSLRDYVALGGGKGWAAAQGIEPDALIKELEASGLRGRGGAGFPTGRKWRVVRENRSAYESASVIVNGAEGEPGTFKDRSILRANPYQVLEGALIAAKAISADQVIVAVKRSFTTEVGRLRSAIAEIRDAGWLQDLEFTVYEGPDEYLYGEETALLETIDGRWPFPRIAPPYRRGVREIVETEADVDSGSGLAAHVLMAGSNRSLAAAPSLVDNVETLANVTRVIAEGEAWFRMQGTAESPGTIVCTVTGRTLHAGVGEVVMGTPLREVLEVIGGGARPGRRLTAVLPGVSNAFIPEELFDVAISYEAFAAIGSGLGSAGFIVCDDSDDLIAITAGVSRFLAVESCGQCAPCKQDGLTLADLLAKLCRSDADPTDVALIERRIETVAIGARCSLARQQEAIVRSLLERYRADVDAHLDGAAPAVEPAVIAELVAIDAGSATVDERHQHKQPDWTYNERWSGKSPADLHAAHHAGETIE
ncbi:MAG: NADH-ubiquinone oxidoreductase-F iron-sulfur binding region domain-containing protein [Acidimicrobiales bacterium]